jgi:SAM-dependent methyltransferase
MGSQTVQSREETASDNYASRLVGLQQAWWKKVLPVQMPYRWNLRRQRLGVTLEVGCGLGRNLGALAAGSIGVDHNDAAIKFARARGAEVYNAQEWAKSPRRKPAAFDGLLFSHILEHMDEAAAQHILSEYVTYLRPGGRVFMVCPQEKGYASDPTHVRFTDGEALSDLARAVGLTPQPWFSFPFPRALGNMFIYNEFCLLASKPA